MLRRLSLALLAIGLTISAPSFAAAQTGISQKVATCDPSYPTRCIKPNASGEVAITGSISATTAAKATAAAPTYIEGTDNPLSVDLSGNLRTTGGSGGGTTVTANAEPPTYVEGSTTNPLSTDLKANLRVVTPDSPVASGNITSTQSVTLTLAQGGYSSYGFQITGTWAGLIIIEGTVDGTNWLPTTAVPLNSTASGAFTANNAGQGSFAGLTAIRFRGNTVNSGTAVVTLKASSGVSAIMQDNLHWSTNVDQINGTTVATGNGTTSAGSQRVTIASDNTAIPTNLSQVAGASVATGHGTASGAIRVELPTDGTGVVNVGTISGSVTLPTNAATSTLQGVQGTGLNPPTGGSGEIGFLSGIYNQVISTAAQAVAPQAQTTGGCTPGVALSAASNNSTLISTGAHTLCKLTVINTTATVYYLRTYDASSAPTCSSATGVTGAYPIPASTTGAGVAVPIGPFGEAYASGLGYCITGASGLNDNTNAATGVTLNYSYK